MNQKFKSAKFQYFFIIIVRLDDKYQKMYTELLGLRKKHKSLKSDLEGKFTVLRHDFDEWKKQEPPVIFPVI